MDCENEYKHQPEPITEANDIIILWDFAIQNDRKIKRNRPDLVVKDYKRKTYLIDMVIPTDNNILIKEYYKISKYKENVAS